MFVWFVVVGGKRRRGIYIHNEQALIVNKGSREPIFPFVVFFRFSAYLAIAIYIDINTLL